MTHRHSATDRNAALLGWYYDNGRDLPWRNAPNPYKTLVSEVMLQQTQVDRVVPKFDRFMELWPTIEDLAIADTTALLTAWSGLGYNSRAVRLRQAAEYVATEGWPTTVKGLQQLPGVGPYTAAAIGSIAFGLPVPAIDTNLTRVLNRWTGEQITGRALIDRAADMIGEPAGDWNQAIMDLGSSLCRPRDPLCGECPVEPWCSDPTVYQPPARQSSFEGSHRQLRGALVKAHIAGENLTDAGVRLSRTPEEVQTAIDALTSEGVLPPP